jgi:hypothetical protein
MFDTLVTVLAAAAAGAKLALTSTATYDHPAAVLRSAHRR